jgi:hypothetical protein
VELMKWSLAWQAVTWSFAGAVTAHNVEEAVFLPEWSRSAGRWHPSVEPADFRVAVLVLTLFLYASIWLSRTGDRLFDYILCGYALAMVLNVFVPHLAATIVMRRYMPGTATAIGLVLPSGMLVLHQSFTGNRIDATTFAWAGPLTVAMMLISIPALFAISRRLRRGLAGSGRGSSEPASPPS